MEGYHDRPPTGTKKKNRLRGGRQKSGGSEVAQGPHSGPAAFPAALSLMRAAHCASRWKSRKAGKRALRYRSRICGYELSEDEAAFGLGAEGMVNSEL